MERPSAAAALKAPWTGTLLKGALPDAGQGPSPLLHKKLAWLFENPGLLEAPFATACTQEVGHGRIETHSLCVTSDFPAGFTGFVGAEQVLRLQRTRVNKRTAQIQQEMTYGLTSLSARQASPKRLLALVRGHWHIGNKSHYVRDVTLDEDHSQVRKGNLPQVLVALRNLFIGWMRQHGHTNIAKACRFHAAQPEQALAMLGL